MKKILTIMLLLVNLGFLAAQPNKKPATQPASSQPDMNKMLEEAMKAEGMSKEEQEAMKKMMNQVMPALNEVNAKTADYPEFSNNLNLVPRKDPAKLAAMPKKALAKTEVGGYASGLYSKMLVKADPTEMALVKKIIAQTPKATDIGHAAILAMLQGHPQAALALSIKAVATDPANLNWQNNMSALLTNYGYPETAMPLLKKLNTDLPVNSTVLNNIGYAWLYLGDPDSAKRYFSFALRVNPMQHESRTAKGLQEDSKGDHEKAGTTYEEAMEISVNPFIDKMLKNNKGKSGIENLDFEKIKQNIAIYEYFPKDWMPELPELHNNVKYYNEDYGMIKGYHDMINEMGDRIKDMSNTLGQELDDLTKKGEDEFVKEMMNANLKGLSMMSKPATVVLGVLSAYTRKWHMDFSDTLKAFSEWKFKLNKKREADIEAINKIIYSGNSKATCEQYKGQLDKIENDFMQQVNPKLRDLLVRKSEEYRQWLNAWCTWNWYVTGNTKNVILMQDVGFTQYLAEMYTTIVTAMEVKTEHCSPPVYEVEKKIDAPKIPDFACPAVVSIPMGAEWEGLVAAAKDFNDNNYGIKKTDKPVPNVSVGYGTNSMVGEPGMGPYVKTAEGTITPGNINSNDDDDLTPLPRLGSGDHAPGKPTNSSDHAGIETDELVPLPFYLAQEYQAKLERQKARNQLLKDLLNQFFETDCFQWKKGPDPKIKMNQKIFNDAIERMRKEAEAQVPIHEDPKVKMFNKIAEEFINRVVKDLVKDALEAYKQYLTGNDPAQNKNNMEEFSRILDHINNLKPSGLDEVERGMKVVNNMKSSAVLRKETPAMLNEIQQGGIQPSVASGLQAPGTFNMPKDLFK